MKPSAKSISEIFDYLPEQDQTTLFEFAEFLKSRAPEPASHLKEPLGLSRPAEESVVAAIKRLKKNYPMIKQKELLNQTSEWMMKHMMQGMPAAEVIDELEVMFEIKYREVVGAGK